VYGNVFTAGGTWIYGYGTYPAPNVGNAFCAIDANQGSALQGLQQLSVFSDYENTGHASGQLIESNVFQQQTIGAADLHTTWTFQFDAKLGNLVSPTQALAFIKTIDPLHGYAMTNFIHLDMAVIPGTWNTYTISIPLDSTALVGQYLQFGFNSTASHYVGSGVFYDNITFLKTSTTAVGASAPSISDLRPASPNPFSNSTRLDYSMAKAGNADLTVYDVTGRRVATLVHGAIGAGPHSVTWTGLSTDGRTVPAGVYNAVLQTASGRITHRIVFNR
jgi:hypothetical protein